MFQWTNPTHWKKRSLSQGRTGLHYAHWGSAEVPFFLGWFSSSSQAQRKPVLTLFIYFFQILLLKHKLGHLAVFAHTAAASSFSCTPWRLEYWHFHSYDEENWQQEAQGRQRWEERGIPARHCRNVELSLWVYVCSLHTCQSTERSSQINPFSGALSQLLNCRKSHTWISNVRWCTKPRRWECQANCSVWNVVGDGRQMYANISGHTGPSFPLCFREHTGPSFSPEYLPIATFCSYVLRTLPGKVV